MCRNIKTLFNFEPPATNDEIQAAALQFVRKISGFHEPSQANQAVFDRGIAETSQVIRHLLDELVTQAHPHSRQVEAARAHQRALERFGKSRPNN